MSGGGHSSPPDAGGRHPWFAGVGMGTPDPQPAPRAWGADGARCQHPGRHPAAEGVPAAAAPRSGSRGTLMCTRTHAHTIDLRPHRGARGAGMRGARRPGRSHEAVSPPLRTRPRPHGRPEGTRLGWPRGGRAEPAPSWTAAPGPCKAVAAAPVRPRLWASRVSVPRPSVTCGAALVCMPPLGGPGTRPRVRVRGRHRQENASRAGPQGGTRVSVAKRGGRHSQASAAGRAGPDGGSFCLVSNGNNVGARKRQAGPQRPRDAEHPRDAHRGTRAVGGFFFHD